MPTFGAMLAAREGQELILSRYSVGESRRLSNVRFRTRVWPAVTLTLPQIGAGLLGHGPDNLASYGWVCGRHEVAHEDS